MNYNLKTIIVLCIVAFSLSVGSTYAQSGISLYHLTNSTFQGNHFNPAFMPEGKIFLGLPVLSGVSVDFNGRISYEDAVTTNELGEREWNIDGIVAGAEKNNYISFEAEISSLYIAWKQTKTHGYSFFIRERMGARGFYGKNLIATLWHGNPPIVGDEIDLSRTALDVRYYREYGIGLWRSIPNKGLNFGVRLKFINGMISAVTSEKFDGAIGFEEDNRQAHFDLNNATINTSGFNIFQGDNLNSHLISNGNIGAGIDLGVHWKINRELSAAISVNDLGFIRWKEDPENYLLSDTTFRFDGINLDDIGNFETAYVDQLKNRLQDTTLNEAYTTGLNTTSYASLMYQLTDNDRFTGSIAAHVVKGRFRMIYSVAYTRKVGKILDVALNVSRIPQQGIDVGLATAVNFGPCQLYMASDKLLRIWDIPKIDAVDFRFGFNFVFGRGRKGPKDDNQDLMHPSPFGKKEKVEKSDGIYWIIKKQKPRPIYEKTDFRDT